MYTKKILTLMVITLGLAGNKLSAQQSQGHVAVVNFATCITDSKYGKKEQENLEYMRKQMTSMMEETEKELKEISSKFEDGDYMDSLSPKADEELRIKYQALNEDLARYQQQFYQVSNQASYQLMQKMNSIISKAAEKVAKKKHLSYVVNKEACFYCMPDLEITSYVIEEMDRDFDLNQKNIKPSEMPKQKTAN